MENKETQDFAQEIRAKMVKAYKDSGLKLYQLSANMNADPRQIDRLLSGGGRYENMIPNARTLRNFADALGYELVIEFRPKE